MSEADLLERLSAIVGPGHVLTDAEAVAGALVEPRGLYSGRARALVRPASTAEVSAVVAACAAARTPITPQGGNTGLVGGQIPLGPEIVLSLKRLNRVREVDALADSMIVEAGVTLAEAQAAAERVDRLFPLSLASEGSCTIGGNLSTNAGGVAVLAYGNARELTTGVEVVLADGRVVNALSKLRKDNTGYDLKDLFVGAEGTLGIITAAALKLFARPRARETAFVGLKDPAAALALFRSARQHFGAGVVSFELMPRIALEFVLRHAAGGRDPLGAAHPWYVLVEIASQVAGGLADAVAEWLGGAAEAGLVDDAALAASGKQRSAFWALRENISDVQKFEGGSIKHDVSVPIGAVPDFLAEASAAVLRRTPGARIVAFGHMGDGNIHFNVSQPVGADKAAFLAEWEAMNAVVHAIVERYQGSFSAEHGIGQLKRALLARKKDPAALDVMRRLKAALDPEGLLNPGKLL
ncbi:MAG TPA: FAD-binding oxidoreductase [Roseiarcus sp.]|nr:FAD-binding oxidoreductase [Roseiarcus sp.]